MRRKVSDVVLALCHSLSYHNASEISGRNVTHTGCDIFSRAAISQADSDTRGLRHRRHCVLFSCVDLNVSDSLNFSCSTQKACDTKFEVVTTRGIMTLPRCIRLFYQGF